MKHEMYLDPIKIKQIIHCCPGLAILDSSITVAFVNNRLDSDELCFDNKELGSSNFSVEFNHWNCCSSPSTTTTTVCLVYIFRLNLNYYYHYSP